MSQSMEDLFSSDAEANRITADAVNPNSPMAKIVAKAEELVKLDDMVERASALLDRLTSRRHQLATRVLPEMFDQAQTDIVGIPGASVDIVVQNYYHASIKADWAEDDKAKAFAHLEALGGGDLIKSELSISFPKEDVDKAHKLTELVNSWLQKHGVDAATSLDMSVNWRSLTTFVKDVVETPIDPHAPETNKPKIELGLLGAFVGRVCKVVKRKPPKMKKTRKGKPA